MESFGLLIGAAVLVLVALGVISFVFSRMKVVPQTHAMVVAGSRGSEGAKVVKPGGRAFIVPVVQKSDFVPLGQINVPLTVSGVDLNKIPLNVDGVAMVKIRQDENSIRDAAERFGNSGDYEAEIGRNLQQVLTGSLRSAIAAMSVEDLLINRETLAKNVREATDAEVAIMGLTVDSLQVLDISDKEGYIKALGAAEAEKVKADARVATAANNQRATDAEVTSQQNIAERNRDLALRQAQLKGETDRAAEAAAAAGPLSKAEQDRAIATLQQETAEQEAMLRERQLDIEVRKPADAEKYRVEVEAAARAEQTKITAAAEAERTKIDAAARAEQVRLSAAAQADQVKYEAQAAAERVRLAGEAEAASTAAIAEAEAKKVSSIGKAEAEATEAKGLAEAQAMNQKADAYAKYGEAAIVELIIQKAPEIARELAAPLSSIDNVTILGGADGAGLNTLSGAVGKNFAELDAVVGNLTGVSLKDMVRGAASGTAAGKLASLTGGDTAVAAATGAATAVAHAADEAAEVVKERTRAPRNPFPAKGAEADA